MPGNTIDFTIVIPVYNGAGHIERAIESCFKQTCLPAKIIVIDDASTDHTAMLMQGLSQDRILYCRNNKNHGPSYCRNLGIQLTNTSWIAFLDADDIFHPQKLEIIRHCIEKDQNIRAIGHAFDLQKEVKQELGNEWQTHLPPVKYFTGKEVLWRNPMVTPSLVISAGNHVLFDETLSYAEDHDFILRTAEKFGMYYLDLPLCSLDRLPLTAGGISSNRWKMRMGEIKMYTRYAQRHHNYFLIPFLVFFSLLKHLKNSLLPR